MDLVSFLPFSHNALYDRYSNGKRLYRARHGERNRRKPQGPSSPIHGIRSVSLLLGANIFNIAADIAAMGEALLLVVGGLKHEHALIFAGGSVLLQIFVPYGVCPLFEMADACTVLLYRRRFHRRYSLARCCESTFLPSLQISSDYLLMIVAIVGTTISPYLFFWQASQEVEEMALGRPKGPLRDLRHGGIRNLKRSPLTPQLA